MEMKQKRNILVHSLSSQMGEATFSLEDEQALRDKIKDDVAYPCSERLLLARLNSVNSKTGKCYTQDEVCNILGKKSRQAIGEWEKGKTFPTTYQCHFLCELYGCDMGYLMGEFDTFRYSYKGVQEETGLSLEAATFLVALKSTSHIFKEGRKPCDTMSQLLENNALHTVIFLARDFDMIIEQAQNHEKVFCTEYHRYTGETLKKPMQKARIIASDSKSILRFKAQNYIDALDAVDLAEYRIHKALESCLQSLIKKEV